MAYNPVPKLTNSNALFGNDLNVSGVSTFDAGIKTPLKDGVDGATITFDMDESNNHSVTLGGNRTLAVSNVDTGQKFTIRLKQDGTGSRTVNWWSGITWFTSTGVPPTLKEDPNTVDYIGFVCTSGGYYDGFHLTESAGGGGGGGGGGATYYSGSGITIDGSNNINVYGGSGNFLEIQMTPIGDVNYPAWKEGVVFYDAESHSLAVYNDEADITLQVGQEEYLRVRNNTGATIYNGTAVMINGVHGNAAPTISGAIANSDYSSQVVGLATHDIEDQSFGYVTTYGIVRDIDTSTFSAGDEIYLSATQIGSGTNVSPVIPNFKVNLGHIINSASSNGSILVQVGQPKLGGGDMKSEAPLNLSGVPFVTQIADTTAGGSQTDPLFIFDSGNRQLQLGSGLQLLDGTPLNNTDVLYNNVGMLTFNGSSIGGGSGNFENINLTSDDQIPLFTFTGSGTTDTPIRMKVLSSYASASTSGTALAFEGTQGQLFGITDNLSSGTIFSVNDITGLPLIAVNASGDVEFAKFGRDIIAHKPILISGGVPSNTTNKLYNDNGTLMFNGSTIGTGGGGGGTGPSGIFEYVELTRNNGEVPLFKFLGSGATDTPINLEVRSSLQSATGSGTALLFQGTQGQLFSITDNLSSGTIFNVSDITGLPMLEVTASGDVEIGEFADTVTIHQPVTVPQIIFDDRIQVGENSYSAISGVSIGTDTGSGYLPYDTFYDFSSYGIPIEHYKVDDNIFVGKGAGSSSQAGKTIAIGFNALTNSKPLIDNPTMFLGPIVSSGVEDCIAIGEYSLSDMNSIDTTGTIHHNKIIGIGSRSFYKASGQVSSAVGVGFSVFEQGVDLLYSNAFGASAGYKASGMHNLYLGHFAGINASGQYNIYIGTNAGSRNYGGSRNIELTTQNGSIFNHLNSNNSDKININTTIIGDTSSKLIAIGNVGTGNLTPDATLEILPKLATDVGVIVQGAVSQTANLQEWQDSSESVLAHIKSDGSLVTSSGNFSGNVAISGSLTAATKSFLIDHPSKEGMHLQYASLEGPENGVYVRGTTDKGFITLPDYWRDLVHNSSITVTLTPVGQFQPLFVEQKSNREIRVGGVCGYYDYVVYGERKDVDKLEVEW